MADTSGTSPKAPASPPAAPGPGSPRAAASPSSPARPSTPPAVPANVGILEADNEQNEADSTFSGRTGGLSDTTSVTSSIYKFREENGRTYHSYKRDESAYWLPNDDRENDRLDLQHNILLLTLDNRLHLAPIGQDKPIKRVLDGGCGTGIWSMEFADEHPETAVIGIDLSPIQPDFVATNLEFFVDDLEEEWNFVQPFDFVYLRMLVGSIRNWPKLFRQAFQHLNPGGYIELFDSISPLLSDDGTLAEDSPLLKWNNLLLEASRKLGSPLDSPLRYKEQLLEAGFQNVVEVEYKWPTNPWPREQKFKELGMWNFENMNAAVQALSLMLLTNVLGWSATEVEMLLVEVRKDLKRRDVHAYWRIWVVYAQKPE